MKIRIRKTAITFSIQCLRVQSPFSRYHKVNTPPSPHPLFQPNGACKSSQNPKPQLKKGWHTCNNIKPVLQHRAAHAHQRKPHAPRGSCTRSLREQRVVLQTHARNEQRTDEGEDERC